MNDDRREARQVIAAALAACDELSWQEATRDGGGWAYYDRADTALKALAATGFALTRKGRA